LIGYNTRRGCETEPGFAAVTPVRLFVDCRNIATTLIDPECGSANSQFTQWLGYDNNIGGFGAFVLGVPAYCPLSRESRHLGCGGVDGSPLSAPDQIVSQYREQAIRVYHGAVFQIKKIPVHS
jgi:hypothetical protein